MLTFGQYEQQESSAGRPPPVSINSSVQKPQYTFPKLDEKSSSQ